MIHSIVPIEAVFSNNNNCSSINSLSNLYDNQSVFEYKEIIYEGERVQVTIMEDGRGVIQRVISSNPGVYMNKNLQPGQMINLTKNSQTY